MRIRKFSAVAVAGGMLVAGLMVTALPASAKKTVPLSAKTAPSKNLTDGKTVKVSGKGWPSGDNLFIVECNSSAAGLKDLNACDVAHIVDVAANTKGVVPATAFVFHTGTIGDGSCNPGGSCFMVLTEGSQSGLHALDPVTIKKAKA
jgi:hypothetical protein